MDDTELIVDLLKDALGNVKNHYENKGQISFDCPVCSYDIKGLDTLEIRIIWVIQRTLRNVARKLEGNISI